MLNKIGKHESKIKKRRFDKQNKILFVECKHLIETFSKVIKNESKSSIFH